MRKTAWKSTEVSVEERGGYRGRMLMRSEDSVEERGGYRGRAWMLSWKDANELGD